MSDVITKRFWLLNNMDWFLSECVYHRDNRLNYNDKKIVVWRLGDSEGRAKIEP
jgi:hypothetical protein